MPNIRIKDIPTTATGGTSSGDFFAIDSNASTRKLDAFAPTFGGNVRIAGIPIVTGDGSGGPYIANSTIADFASGQARFYGRGPNATTRATLGLYSTYSDGTGGLALQTFDTSGNVTFGTSASSGTSLKVISGVGTLASPRYSTLDFRTYNNDGSGAYIRTGNRQSDTNQWLLEIATRSNANVLTHVATFFDSGLLLGATVPGNNGRLQLASHTDSTGGIGFGTDTSLYRTASGSLRIEPSSGQSQLGLWSAGNGDALVMSVSGAIGRVSAQGDLVLRSNTSATALTLDTSQNATFAKDIFLGTSGPSVPSTLSGRAPRQGLVFDGTTATSSSGPALGTQCTIAFTVRLSTISVQIPLVFLSGSGFIGTRNVSGALFWSSAASDFTSLIAANKTTHIAIVANGTTATPYIDGVAGTPIAYTASVGGLVNLGYAGNPAFEMSGVATYNRALSAAEVKALYENGAPAAADINSASNTSLLTGANSDFSSVGDWVPNPPANISGGKLNLLGTHATNNGVTLRAGKRYRLVCTIDSITAGFFAVFNGVSYLSVATVAGAVSYEFNVAATTLLFVRCTGGDAVIDNMFIYPVGAVLAPDAAQTGNGLTWWDTSGNYANITLPTSGVRWNVPTSGNLYLSGTDGLTLDTNGSATLRYADNNLTKWWLYKLSGDINLYLRDMVNARMQAVFTPGASDITASSDFYSNLVTKGTFYVDSTTASIILGRTSGSALSYDIRPIQAGGSIRIRQDASTADRYIALGRVDNLGAFTESMRVIGSNVLIGTTTDSGALLQVAGSGYFSGQLDLNAGTAAAPSLKLNGTNNGIYYTGSNIVRIAANGTEAATFSATAATLTGTLTAGSGTHTFGNSANTAQLIVQRTTTTPSSVTINATSSFANIDFGSEGGGFTFGALRSNGVEILRLHNSNLAQITNVSGGGLAIGGGLRVSAQTASNDTTSGAVVISGGVGIAGNTYIGGNLVVSGTITPSGGGGGGGGSTNVWIPASQWIPRTTTGCGVDSTQTTTNLQNFDELLFDPATIEYAQALVRMPSNYNNGTITARFFWSSSSGSGAVVWGLQARAFADDDALDTAFGTAQTTTDTLIATGDMHVSAATSAITVGGTPAATTPIQFQLYREATAGGDTLAVDARLLGVEISYTSV